MKQLVYIVLRCYGQEDYLIPCANSDLDGRVPRLSLRLVGYVGGVNCNPLNPNPQEYLRPKRRKISQRKQVYNMHAVHNQISEEII